MDITPFIMVLLGCVSGQDQCEPIMTLPAAYASQESCLAARADILSAVGDDRVVAECRPQLVPAKLEIVTGTTA